MYNILFQFQVELSHLEDGGEKKVCFKCGGDHMAKDCEQPDKFRKCGEEGHMSKDCETGYRHCYGHKDDSYINEYEDKPKYGHHGYHHSYGHKMVSYNVH